MKIILLFFDLLEFFFDERITLDVGQCRHRERKEEEEKQDILMFV